MTIVVQAHDATGSNFGALPPGQAAGYVTGSGGVPWTAAQWAARRGAVRIDQTPAGTQWDDTADVDDYENGAVQLGELAGRAKARQAAFTAGKRPGQRRPAIYMSADNVTSVIDALEAGGVHSGVYLWIAHWGLTDAEADNLILDGSGPFPVIGVQNANNGAYDSDRFSQAWLDDVSGGTPPPPPPPSNWQEDMMRQLPALRVGAQGEDVRSIQALCVARGHAVAVDGSFGPLTEAAVKAVQAAASLAQDGTVGQQTWQALMAV